MANDSLHALIQQGLAAMKAGSKITAESADDIQKAATNPQLKAALAQDNEQAKHWTLRIERSFEAAGGKGKEENPIVEANDKISKRICSEAPDDYSRDLGIIAAGQTALLYWVASFGSIGAYAEQAGMSQAAQDLRTCLQEAKQADEQYTQIAQQILRAN